MQSLSSYNNGIISVGYLVEKTTSNVIDNIHYLHRDIEENFAINYPLDLLLLKMQKSRIIDNNANALDICKKEFLILNEVIKNNIFSFFTIPLEFGKKGFNLSIQDLLKHLQEFCKNKNIRIKSIAIVGSSVPFLLGVKYFKEAFKKLDPTLELSEGFFKSFSKTPSDYDIRIYFNDDSDNPISDEQLDSFNHAIRNLIVDCITKKNSNIQLEEISKKTKKHLSKSTFFYGNDGIYTISRINSLNKPPIELLGIKHLAREFLFDQDALRLVITDNNGKFEITLNCSIQNYWQPIIDRPLKLIRSSDNLHTINLEAWPIYLSLLAKGYRCVDKELHNTLKEKITKHGINENEITRLLQKKVLADLSDSNSNATFAIIFMGIEMLRETSDTIQITEKPKIFPSTSSVINSEQEKFIWNLLPSNIFNENDKSNINLNSILKKNYRYCSFI